MLVLIGDERDMPVGVLDTNDSRAPRVPTAHRCAHLELAPYSRQLLRVQRPQRLQLRLAAALKLRLARAVRVVRRVELALQVGNACVPRLNSAAHGLVARIGQVARVGAGYMVPEVRTHMLVGCLQVTCKAWFASSPLQLC